MLEIWPKVKRMTWSERIVLHSSPTVSSSWTHLWYFDRSILSLSNVIAEKLLVTSNDLKWPLRNEEGSLAAIFRFRASTLSETRCLRVFQMVFVQKKRFSIFPHWHNGFSLSDNGEVAKLTWSCVIDIKIPRYKHYECCYRYQSLKISR